MLQLNEIPLDLSSWSNTCCMHRETSIEGCTCRHKGQRYSPEQLISRARSQHLVHIACWHPMQAAGSSRNCMQMLQQKQAAGLYALPQFANSKHMPRSASLSKMSTGRSMDIVGGRSSPRIAQEGNGEPPSSSPSSRIATKGDEPNNRAMALGAK